MIRDISKDEILDLPLLKYSGPIKIVDSKKKLSTALDHLREHDIVGFDTETKPAFKRGVKHDPALIQLASEDRVYIVQLRKTGFSKRFNEVFENNNLLKVGIGLKDDIRDLQSLETFKPAAFFDLNEKAPKLGFQKIGARNLSAMILGHRISKSQQVSNWENDPLTEAQIAYAATDAYICLEIYKKLRANCEEELINLT